MALKDLIIPRATIKRLQELGSTIKEEDVTISENMPCEDNNNKEYKSHTGLNRTKEQQAMYDFVIKSPL